MACTFVTFPITKVIGGSSLINPYIHVQASLFPMAFVYWIDGLARTKGINDGMGKKKMFWGLKPTEMYFLPVLEVRNLRSNVSALPHSLLKATWENLILSLPASDYILIEGIILNVITLSEKKRFLMSIPHDASSLKNTCKIKC